MKRLSEAIQDKFLLNPSLVSLVTGFYHTEAPKGTAFPYGIYSLVSDTKGYRLDARVQECLVRFNFYTQDYDSVNVEDIADAFNDVYDECTLYVAGRNFGYCQRETTTQIKDDATWQQSTLYRVALVQPD